MVAAPVAAAAVGAAPAPTVTVTYDDGTAETLTVVAPGRLRRDAEPFVLEVDPALTARLRAGVAAVADRTLLAADPYLLRAIAAPPVEVTMGASFEAWTASAGTADVAAITALRDLCGDLTAADLGGAAPAPRRTLTLRYAAPPVAGGAAATHTIVVGAATADGGCRVAVDGVAARLAADACAILRAPLTTSR